MKEKYICPYCGQINETKEKCSNCGEINFLEKVENPIDQDYFNMNIYINNNDYYKILDLSKKYPNNLYYEYFKMYASISLEKEISINDFFSKTYTFTPRELNDVCMHMIEKKNLYNENDIKSFFDKYNYNSESFIELINSNMNEQVMEKDLREELFPLSTILPTNSKTKTFKHGTLYLLLLSFILLVLFTFITIVATEKELQYNMLIVALIIPSIFLTKSFTKIVIKNNNIIISIISFIFIYYIITYFITLPYHELNINSFYEHLKTIIFTPFNLVKVMHERMN